MLALRLTGGLDFSAFAARHGFDLMERRGSAARSLMMLDLLRIEGDALKLTERGMDVQNAVLLELLDGLM